jgi:hypothetical protein
MQESETTSIPLIDLLDEADRRRARKDCVFFIEHYLKTFDPRPEAYPHNLDFILYDFQKEYVYGLVQAIREGYDIFDEKSRDVGASWLALGVRFWMWLVEEGYQSLVGSRKEDYVDNGTLDSLFGKLDYFILNIKDPLILPEGFDMAKHRNHMKLVNPVNGNVIKGESSNKNFSRAGRYKDVLFDEIGFWPDAKSSWAAAGDATRCRQAVTTPPDEPSYAKVLRFSGQVMIRTWHWRLHPNKDDKWYAYEKGRRTEEEVLHEIDISWEYSSTGRPYPEINDVPFGQSPYNQHMPLFVSIDLGLDALAIGYYQQIQNSEWINLVETFEASDKIIEWYFPFFGLEECVNVPECPHCGKQHNFEYNDKQLAFMKQIKDWNLNAYQHDDDDKEYYQPIFFGDPSGKQRHIESGVSPYSILQEHGIDVQVNDLENDWIHRRDATKRLMTHLTVNDTEYTRWWLECLKNAHYPKREETSQAVNPITKPVHDWTSHHRTQTEFFAVNYKGDYLIDTGFMNRPELNKQKAEWRGKEDGTIEGTGIDVASLLTQNDRDWRSM